MSRGLSSEMQSASEATFARAVAFWYGDFLTGPVRISTYTRDLTWGGYTWNALGQLIGFEELRETGSVEAVGAVFTLNGVQSALVSKALESGYRRRRCSLYIGFLDASEQVIANPIEHRFLMDRMTIQDDGATSRITVRAESRLVDLQRPREIRQNDEGQRAVFPNDRAFEFVAGLAGKEFVIGGTARGPTPPATQVGPDFGNYNTDML